MEIKYNDLEKKEYEKVISSIKKLLFYNLFVFLWMSLPLVIGIINLVLHYMVLGIFFTILGSLAFIIGSLPLCYSIKLCIISDKNNYKIYRKQVSKIPTSLDTDNNSIYYIEIQDEGKTLFINTTDSVLVKENMEVDVVYNSKGKRLFAIPQINVFQPNSANIE